MVFLAAAFGVFGLVVSLYSPLSSPLREVCAAASLLYLAGVWVATYRPAVFANIRGALPALPFRREDPFIPLSQACRELYEANINGELGRCARGHTDGSEAEILNWLGYWVTARFVTVYGKRTASTIMEPLPPGLHQVGGLVDGAARFERAGFETWTDLSVRRDAFRAMIPELSDTTFPDGA